MSFLKGLFSSVAWTVTKLCCFYTILLFFLGYTLWVSHWVVGFLLLSMPIALFGCVVLLIYWLFKDFQKALWPLLTLLIGWPFLKRTLVYNPTENIDKEAITILSYNAMFFDIDAYSSGKSNGNNAQKMMTWVKDFKADVKVFEEFYNWEGQPRFRQFNTTEQFSKQLPYHVFMKPPLSARMGKGFVGLAIFSRYPLIYRQEKSFSDVGNGFLIADLVRKKDTLRLINVHLHSMGIRVGKILRQNDYEKAKSETRNVLHLLKNGFVKRTKEVEEIVTLIEQSPYPIVLCGDLNEVPYGYAYGKIREQLNNSFEEAGRGFGFSYNRLPKLIRIDNQFHNSKLQVLDFQTQAVKFSDHYPISASYKIINSP